MQIYYQKKKKKEEHFTSNTLQNIKQSIRNIEKEKNDKEIILCY